MARPNWTRLKTEYATGSLSYAKLAAKHKIPIRSLEDHAKADGWVAARREYRGKIVAKTIDAASDREADRRARIMTAADRLMDVVEAALADPEALSASPKGLKAVAETIAKAKEIQDIRSERDMQEQDARIANLRKQAEQDDSPGDIRIVLDGDLSEYAK